MHAECTAFLCRNLAEFLGVLEISRGAKRHCVRKNSSSKEMRWKDTALKIPSNQQWEFRFLLQFVEQHDRLNSTVNGACRPFRWHGHGQRPYVVFANVVA